MPHDRKRLPIDDRVRIQHMLEAARDIRQYILDRTRSDLDTDSMLLRAMTNAVQQIGEAAVNVSDEALAVCQDYLGAKSSQCVMCLCMFIGASTLTGSGRQRLTMFRC